MLRALPLVIDPNVIVGLAPADDAAVVRVSDELGLVFTTDFFTPLVDDPRERIARAVDPDPVEQALGEGIAAALTPPLGLTSDPTAPVLSVDVNSWGVRQAESGYVNRGPSTFWFTMRARIYDTKDRAIFSIEIGRAHV